MGTQIALVPFFSFSLYTPFSFCLLSKEVHDVCHCLRTSYDKLSQVLLVRTIQLGTAGAATKNKLMAAASSTTSINSSCNPDATAYSPSAGLEIKCKNLVEQA